MQARIMGDVLPFKKPTKKLGMCQHGHHKWVVDTTKKFDVHKGKLVTRYTCARCGKVKIKGE
jgi:hypothetical protein